MKYANVLETVDAAIKDRKIGLLHGCSICRFYIDLLGDPISNECAICVASWDHACGCAEAMERLFPQWNGDFTDKYTLKALRDLRQIIINNKIEA